MDDIIAACMAYEPTACNYEDFPVSDDPVWLLGKKYSTKVELDALRADVVSKLWLTYRKNFPSIDGTSYTSDKGWGCMLRCGQMVIAEAISRIYLGKDWRWTPELKNATYSKIVSLFMDDPHQLYSIHRIALGGAEDGKPVGEWYGPNTVAHVLKKLCKLDDWSKLCITVVMDNCFIIDEMKRAALHSDSKVWNPLLIFIPLRLGVTEVNSIYIDGIKSCLKMPQSLGIIGGTPNHALYFIGYVGDEIVYLDPHTTQDSFLEEEHNQPHDEDASFHCDKAQRMPIQSLDPSLALCFLCQSEKEYDDLCNRLRQDLVISSDALLFELLPTRPEYMKDDEDMPNIAGAKSLDFEDFVYDSNEDEDFEVLQC